MGITMHRARAAAWGEICQGLDTDMWGRPYRAVMTHLKVKAPPPYLSKHMAREVLEGLFPTPGNEEQQ